MTTHNPQHDYMTKKDMALWREFIKNDFTLATEIIQGNIDSLESRINEKLDRKLDKNYFVEYMDDFKDLLLKNKRRSVSRHE